MSERKVQERASEISLIDTNWVGRACRAMASDVARHLLPLPGRYMGTLALHTHVQV